MLLEVMLANCLSGHLGNGYGIFLPLCQSTWPRKAGLFTEILYSDPSQRFSLISCQLEIGNCIIYFPPPPRPRDPYFHDCPCNPGDLSSAKALLRRGKQLGLGTVFCTILLNIYSRLDLGWALTPEQLIAKVGQ